MSRDTFRALVVEASSDGSYRRSITQRSLSDLPRGDVLIRVKYSSLNYKDALSASGNKGVTRKYPHTPGIDASGVVAESGVSRFKSGDQVLVTGYDLGMNTSGGFAGYIRVPGDWVVPLPPGLDLKDSMILGTAGFTAGMSLDRLIHAGITPDRGEVLVTGATGGVGSLAVAILLRAGYNVVASSGKPEAVPFLESLGARQVMGRDELKDVAGKPLLPGRWAGVVDTVGGEILVSAIKSALPHGAVSCCGLVASPKLELTVFPFILRGVSLFGIDSANCPMTLRMKVWEKLASDWKPDTLDKIGSEIGLETLDENIDLILQGRQTGRKIVNLDA